MTTTQTVTTFSIDKKRKSKERVNLNQAVQELAYEIQTVTNDATLDEELSAEENLLVKRLFRLADKAQELLHALGDYELTHNSHSLSSMVDALNAQNRQLSFDNQRLQNK